MDNSQKIIQEAFNEIGNKEVPNNSNKTKYGKWFGFDGVAWCGMFVSWVYARAGFSLGNIGFLKGFAGCQTAVAHFRQTGEITENPLPGDIVFFDFNKDGRYDHTGIFFKRKSKSFECIEGNTSFKNQANGGEVMLRVTRFYTDAIFVHPKILDKPIKNKTMKRNILKTAKENPKTTKTGLVTAIVTIVVGSITTFIAAKNPVLAETIKGNEGTIVAGIVGVATIIAGYFANKKDKVE